TPGVHRWSLAFRSGGRPCGGGCDLRLSRCWCSESPCIRIVGTPVQSRACPRSCHLARSDTALGRLLVVRGHPSASPRHAAFSDRVPHPPRAGLYRLAACLRHTEGG